MAIIKLSPIEKRRLSVFLSCLLLAFVAWIFAVLSSPHNFIVNQLVVYKNAPQKRAFHSLQSDTVKATVQGNGWQMLFHRLSETSKTINVDLSSLDKRNYVVLSSQLRNINFLREAGNPIIAFDPDTLYFDFSTRRVKRVPVQLIKAINYEKQYAQSNSLSIKPDYITVSGPAEVLNSIAVWETDTLQLDNINSTVNTQVKLRSVKQGNMSIYPKSVQVNIPVDEFTEKTLQIPIKILNNHNYYNVKLLPQKVSVTVYTSLSDYSNIDEAFFEATVDLSLWESHGYSTLPVKINRIPPFCRVVKIKPTTVDFIVRNNAKSRANR